MANAKRKPKGTTVRVNFTGVQAGGGGRLLPEEVFTFEVEDVELKNGEESGEPYLNFTLRVTEGKYKGTKAWDIFSLQPQALWKLRGFMETVGMEVIEGDDMDIDYKELEGLIVQGEIIHEMYQNKPKHRISAYLPLEAEAKSSVREEARGSGRRRAPKPDPEPEWQKGQKVSFKEDNKTLNGTIISTDQNSATIRVGRDEYDVDFSELEAA